MAYSGWKHEREMSLKEKKTAWGVLEAFPTYKAKMKLKEKFSIRLIRRTYKWLIKVNNAMKEKKPILITNFMSMGCQGCHIFLEDAFEIQDVPVDAVVRDKYKHRRSHEEDTSDDDDDDVNDSDSEDNADTSDDDSETELTEEEMKEFMNVFGGMTGSNPQQQQQQQQANNPGRMMGQGLGQMMGGMLGGMMQGLVGGMMDKDQPLYRMYQEKHQKLKDYLDENKDRIPKDDLEQYKEMLKILRNIVESYDQFENNPLGHTQYLDKQSKLLKAMDIEYPEEIDFDEEAYSSAVAASLLQGSNQQQGGGNTEAQECCIM